MCEFDKASGKAKLTAQSGERSRIPAVNACISKYEDKSKKWLNRLTETIVSRANQQKGIKISSFEFGDILTAFYQEYVKQIYNPMFIEGLNIGADQFILELIKQGTTGTRLSFDPETAFFISATNNGLEAVKLHTIKENDEIIREIMIKTIKEGGGMEDFTRQIRKVIPERQWVYNRLVRSETALAYDVATIKQAKNDGIEHVQYKASLRPCPVCLPFSNQIWKTGENPRIVYDTHPHCLCHIIPKVYIRPGTTIQPKYEGNLGFPYPIA